MTGARIPVTVLCAQYLANVSEGLRKALRLPAHCRSVALLSTDCDDATYIAFDEATKKANVEVVYARSLYAGAANASTKLAGEVIGILGGSFAFYVLWEEDKINPYMKDRFLTLFDHDMDAAQTMTAAWSTLPTALRGRAAIFPSWRVFRRAKRWPI